MAIDKLDPISANINIDGIDEIDRIDIDRIETPAPTPTPTPSDFRSRSRSRSSLTLLDRHSSEKMRKSVDSEKMNTDTDSNPPEIRSRDYVSSPGGEVEIGNKMPIEAEAEAEKSRPPSFKSIVQDDMALSRTGINEKGLSIQKAIGSDSDLAEEVEMIDGRPKDIYDRFSPSQKRLILAIVSYSAIIAPMTSSIFLPSIPQMADQLHTSAEVINYTVAVFIVVIGIAPVFWSPYAGFYGRRPVYLASMPIMVVASIGVALSKNVGGLTGARIIQGIGSSCFLSVGAGSIGDIYRPTERSRGMSAFYMVALLGPAVSPALAGVFTEYTPAGWRSCQYFLAGMGALSVFAVFFFLPETSHPPLPHDTLKKEQNKKFVWFFCNPLSSLGLLRWPNILLATFISSVAMIDTYVLLVPLSSVFKDRYKIQNLAIVGCLYLASGAGNILGSKLIGPWADKVVVRQLAKRGYRRPEDRLKAGYLGAFILMPLSSLGYGWLIQYGAGGIAPPLVMVFINGLALMFVVAPLNTYLVDAMQTRSAEVIAVNNCIRYLFSAAASACVLPIANAIGWGITMTICTVLTWLSALALYLLYKYGDRWRERANERYGITSKQADEERVEGGKDEESAVQHDSQVETQRQRQSHEEENDEHPIELGKITSTTTKCRTGRSGSIVAATSTATVKSSLASASRPTPIQQRSRRQSMNNSNNAASTGKGELPNVEQVLKRTVSLSGASAHGGG
ncbi:uncharacterized protein I303_108021 [Kwoniella dejecticola CBS 10117]|uniref:Dityrosine transporter n=1 Tax=Kwoniella dejecticola CBS 10117 TaxID=1296121 RepID=A0A1A5ZWB1_9TREE|nr:dityrosine transporter [Kwoniella dejecticola CBS 10117]OBR82098.1 dityrosine transporter [Kwoniella dejecticola CBS 10117]